MSPASSAASSSSATTQARRGRALDRAHARARRRRHDALSRADERREALAARPACWKCSSCSSARRCRPRTSRDAALFRAIEKLKPTLLLDEADAIFGKRKAREREDLRGLSNAGWRRGAVARRMGGAKMTTLEAFPVFCPKAFAGIGDYLPDTLSDRAIRIRLERTDARGAGRAVPPPRGRCRRARAARPARRLAGAAGRLSCARRGPTLPDELDDRAQDCLGAAARDRRPRRRRLARARASGRGRALERGDARGRLAQRPAARRHPRVFEASAARAVQDRRPDRRARPRSRSRRGATGTASRSRRRRSRSCCGRTGSRRCR